MSGTIYHIKKNGDPGICRAQSGKCPLGDEHVHFTSKEAARDYYEKHADELKPALKKAPAAPRLTPAEKRVVKAKELLAEAEKELKDVTKAKNRVARDFRNAEAKIRENILDPKAALDPRWPQAYEKAKVQSEVIDKMLKESQDKFNKATRELLNAEELATPKPKPAPRPTTSSRSYYSPDPEPYYGCGGGRGC